MAHSIPAKPTPIRLLKRLQLIEKKDAGYATLSGGQQQRLALALALINDPQMLFLDEPTTGLDPQVRLEIRDLIEELRADKRTIVMTTHYIEEAERLCDRVAIIDAGQIIAIGTPRDLQEKSANQSAIVIKLSQPLKETTLPDWPEAIRSVVSDNRTRHHRLFKATGPDIGGDGEMDRHQGIRVGRRAAQSSDAGRRFH